MSCKYVPIYNVSPCGGYDVDNLSIQDVLEDFTTVKEYKKERNINLADIFVSPNIVNSYIDPDWCAGETDEERFIELSIDDPISCYDYIHYGGCVLEDVPEIYFSNLRGWAPKDVELLADNAINFGASYPWVGLYPDLSVLDPYYVPGESKYPGDPRYAFNPAYYREGGSEFLQRYGISSKVKVDYDGELPPDINFKLKVTTVLGSDYIAKNRYYYTSTPSVKNPYNYWIPFPLLATLPPTAMATWLWLEANEYLNYLWGPLKDVLVSVAEWLGTEGALNGFGALFFAGIALYIVLRTTIEIADVIFGIITEWNQNTISTGYKIWDILTGGNYNNYDIQKSSLLLNHDVFKQQLDNIIEIVARDGVYETDIINYNNLDLSKWYNFETRPRGAAYDKMTPPPSTMYIVEIIPISNCVISKDPNKTHIISFTCSPDKYVQPNFDVIPSNIICNGTIMKLQDAIYADFIYLMDKERSGTFDPYHNIVINTANYKNNETTIYLPYTGEHIINFSNVISNNRGGLYEILFMKEMEERNQQLIFNHNMVDRGYGTDDYNVIKKYWTVPSNWVFSGGAVYRKNNIDTQITQYMPNFTGKINWAAVFKFEIDVVNCSAGKAYLNLDGLFELKLCEDRYNGGGDHPGSVGAIRLDVADYPDNVTLVGNRVYFNGSGYYTIYLEAKKDNVADKVLKIGGDSSFNGGISKVILRRLSPYSPTREERAVPMYKELVNFSNCGADSQVFYMLVDHQITGQFQFTLGNFEYGGYSEEVKVDVDWGDGTFDTHTISTGTHSFSHTYTTQQSLLNYLVKVRINPYIKGMDAPILPYLKCNNSALIDFADYYGKLYGGTIDFAYTGLKSSSIIDSYTKVYHGSEYIYGKADDGTFSRYDVDNYAHIPILSRFLGLKKLVLNDTNIWCDLHHLGGISEYIDITNTKITGDLSKLSLVSNTIKCDNTRVFTYNTVVKMHCKNIRWQNSDPNIDTNSLNDLVRDLYNSSIRDGTLYIAGTNPNIIDDEILWFIFQLVHYEDWTIIYNGYYITAENRDNYLQTGKDDYVYTK